MKYNISNVDKTLMTKRPKGKRALNEDLDRNIANQLPCLDAFIKGINECDKKDLLNTKAISNLSTLINIISLDLKVIQRDLHASNNDWIQRYFIRQAYLLIYEFFEIVSNKLNLFCFDAEKKVI